MGHSTEDLEELLGLQPLLDSDAGPARHISHQQALEMVRTALERASTAHPLSQLVMQGRTPRGRRLPRRARTRRTLR